MCSHQAIGTPIMFFSVQVAMARLKLGIWSIFRQEFVRFVPRIKYLTLLCQKVGVLNPSLVSPTCLSPSVFPKPPVSKPIDCRMMWDLSLELAHVSHLFDIHKGNVLDVKGSLNVFGGYNLFLDPFIFTPCTCLEKSCWPPSLMTLWIF